MAQNKKSSGGIFGGIIAGLIFIIGGICLLWWNEGRTVKTQAGIDEAEKEFVQVTSESIDSNNEGKLIATNGDLDLSKAGELKDDEFGIKVLSAIMERTVEMYQWKETCETDDDNNETCSYKKIWSEEVINSSGFTKSGYTNPSSIPYESKTYIADIVEVGAFVIPKTLIEHLDADTDKKSSELLEEYTEKKDGYVVDGKYITTMTDSSSPKIGDIRISYSYNDADSVSILAVQNGNTFTEYTSKAGTTIYRIKEGIYTGKDIVIDMTNENKMMKWLLRLAGTILLMIGIASILSPIQRLANFVPLLGNVVSFATGLISFVLGLAMALVVIAVAWFRFRPLLSIILIIVVAALIVFLITMRKKKAPVSEEVSE